MGLFDFWRRTPKQSGPSVRFTDEAVTHVRADGRVETMPWDDLEEVGVLTTSDGPIGDDVFWMLLGPDHTGCAIPSSADGMDALLARLQSLPNFDNEAVIRAMGSTTDARFRCWTKRQ